MCAHWGHYQGLRGFCPVCGKPSHVCISKATGRYFWIHDSYGIDLLDDCHGARAERAPEIPFRDVHVLIREARKRGADLAITPGAAEPRPVYCVETRQTYPSISSAARSASRCSKSIKDAIARQGTSAGLHWQYA